MISGLESKLKEETELKDQALEDQQYMSEVYKDFESRESQLRSKEDTIALF